jgi:CBS domain-containing protein
VGRLNLCIDLAQNAGQPIGGVMTTDPVTVASDADIERILDLLADDERDINRLPVVSEGQPVGIVARQDVLRTLRDERVESKR